jgi:hypothetical protein
MIAVPVSTGELIDKITILEIKQDKITNAGQLANVERELELLNGVATDAGLFSNAMAPLKAELQAINNKLWVVEDDIRALEAEKRFDADFIELARSVYKLNDVRAQIKRRINTISGSDLVEEKSYVAF